MSSFGPYSADSGMTWRGHSSIRRSCQDTVHPSIRHSICNQHQQTNSNQNKPKPRTNQPETSSTHPINTQTNHHHCCPQPRQQSSITIKWDDPHFPTQKNNCSRNCPPPPKLQHRKSHKKRKQQQHSLRRQNIRINQPPKQNKLPSQLPSPDFTSITRDWVTRVLGHHLDLPNPPTTINSKQY